MMDNETAAGMQHEATPAAPTPVDDINLRELKRRNQRIIDYAKRRLEDEQEDHPQLFQQTIPDDELDVVATYYQELLGVKIYDPAVQQTPEQKETEPKITVEQVTQIYTEIIDHLTEIYDDQNHMRIGAGSGWVTKRLKDPERVFSDELKVFMANNNEESSFKDRLDYVQFAAMHCFADEVYKALQSTDIQMYKHLPDINRGKGDNTEAKSSLKDCETRAEICAWYRAQYSDKVEELLTLSPQELEVYKSTIESLESLFDALRVVPVENVDKSNRQWFYKIQDAKNTLFKQGMAIVKGGISSEKLPQIYRFWGEDMGLADFIEKLNSKGMYGTIEGIFGEIDVAAKYYQQGFDIQPADLDQEAKQIDLLIEKDHDLRYVQVKTDTNIDEIKEFTFDNHRSIDQNIQKFLGWIEKNGLNARAEIEKSVRTLLEAARLDGATAIWSVAPKIIFESQEPEKISDKHDLGSMDFSNIF